MRSGHADLGAAENAPKRGAHGVGDAEVQHSIAHVCVIAKHEGEQLCVRESFGGCGDERSLEREFVELCHRCLGGEGKSEYTAAFVDVVDVEASAICDECGTAALGDSENKV